MLDCVPLEMFAVAWRQDVTETTAPYSLQCSLVN